MSRRRPVSNRVFNPRPAITSNSYANKARPFTLAGFDSGKALFEQHKNEGRRAGANKAKLSTITNVSQFIAVTQGKNDEALLA
jgi:hypothetical protein